MIRSSLPFFDIFQQCPVLKIVPVQRLGSFFLQHHSYANASASTTSSSEPIVTVGVSSDSLSPSVGHRERQAKVVTLTKYINRVKSEINRNNWTNICKSTGLVQLDTSLR